MNVYQVYLTKTVVTGSAQHCSNCGYSTSAPQRTAFVVGNDAIEAGEKAVQANPDYIVEAVSVQTRGVI